MLRDLKIDISTQYRAEPDSLRSAIAWRLRSLADRLDRHQSVGIRITGDTTPEEVTAAWRIGYRAMRQALEGYLKLRAADQVFDFVQAGEKENGDES